MPDSIFVSEGFLTLFGCERFTGCNGRTSGRDIVELFRDFTLNVWPQMCAHEAYANEGYIICGHVVGDVGYENIGGNVFQDILERTVVL